MTPSPQQEAIFAFPASHSGSLNLVARAGTGKTTTLVELCHRIPYGRITLAAFNRAIADELQSRLPARPGLTANTIHGIGLKAWKSVYRRVEVDGNKVRNIARATWARDSKTANAAETIIGYMKGAGLGINAPYEDLDEWEKIIDHFDLEDEIPSSIKRKVFLESCVWTYEMSLECCEGKGAKGGIPTLDFNDMLLAPLYHRVPFPQVEWAMLDEAQDTSMLRRLIMLAMLKSGGRMVAVGDEFQAIYGFAGADNTAMELIKNSLGSHELPLNVTYRCPRAVVELAQQWVPDFTAHESAPAGIVRTIDHEDFWGEHLNPGTDVILCRVTRPLVGVAIALRNRGIPCVVEGQSAKSLTYLANKWGDIPLPRFMDMLAGYAEEYANEHAEDLAKVARMRDRVGTVMSIALPMGQGKTTKDLRTQIEFMFREGERDRAGVLVLCTIHRAKGREWDRVFLLGRNRYQPGWWVTQPWELDQERNLEYVAVTRTKKELVEVDVPEPQPGKREERQWWDLE
jgi:superfamily I DNA/RNA helicase